MQAMAEKADQTVTGELMLGGLVTLKEFLGVHAARLRCDAVDSRRAGRDTRGILMAWILVVKEDVTCVRQY
ncbi:MAG: hypothetical protein USCGTAYLOR_01759 [Chromatiales bacterium USCg_Taylor]|nr:MAG: hypothetical protein USCGTAYLOR_01759 [Chromatiales bacterium USCg_Taylor]